MSEIVNGSAAVTLSSFTERFVIVEIVGASLIVVTVTSKVDCAVKLPSVTVKLIVTGPPFC